MTARAANMAVAVGVGLACGVELLTMGAAVTPLVLALIVSYVIWMSRDQWGRGPAVVVPYVAALVVQVAHLAEEYRAGFYRDYPPIVGGDPWPAERFLTFNVVWLAVFVVAAVGIVARRRLAYLVALFLAIGGGVGNGIGHLALALRAGGYFPGAYTAPLAIVAGAVLLVVLLRPASHPTARA